ncbi:RNA polymerase sigma factor [Marinitenerispora sediminis]|uniref:RNA polymerase sigma factor n=1 Tax=Marinitenerispora sediminis TaxID=1931232 RepID=UPI0015F169AF|nr:sigma-70 family RNA polymerase sigma factor [Marinitenerispora sediminis]
MTDRDLVRALRSSRVPAASSCAQLYDAYGAELYQRCWLTLRDCDAAQAAVRDTLIVARSHADQLVDPTRLRDWLLAIASAECERHRGTVEAVRGPGGRPAEDAADAADAAHPPPASLRLRVLSCVSSPGLAGYRAHVADRADRFDRYGFPDPRARTRHRPSSYLLPGLLVTACALLLLLLVLMEFLEVAPAALSGWTAGTGTSRGG